MKVLMIEHFLPGNLYTKELCTHLCKNVSMTLLTRKGYEDDGQVSWKAKPCLCYSAPPNKVLSFLCIVRGWIQIIKELCTGKYDIVHVQTFKVDTVEMLIYRFLAKGRLVHTAHNILPHEASAKDKRKYGKFYSKCNLIIVHNEYSKELIIREYGFEDRIRVISHGIYESQKKAIGDESAVIRSQKTEFLQLGMIRKYKGVDIFLKALSLLDETVKSKIHVTIAGKQYPALDKTDYKKMIEEYNLETTVTFSPQRVEDQEMDQLFQKADVCVFPYREVYGSGALLMAYTYGKPVIVSDIPAFVEETDHGRTGLMFKSEDSQSLKEAIETFTGMPHEEIRKFEVHVKELVDEKYNWEKSAGALLSYYHGLLASDKI